MTSRIYIVDLLKTAKRATNTKTLQTQISHVHSRILDAGRDKKGWVVESSRIEQRYAIDISLINRCRLSIQCKPRVARTTAAYDVEFNHIVYIIRTAIRVHKWTIEKIDGREPPAEVVLDPTNDDSIAESKYVDLRLPDEWQDHFSHLYERDAHINIIHDTIQIAIESEWKHRFHTLLYGPPGTAKTDITVSVKEMVGADSVLEFDATSTTSAGAIRNLEKRDLVPRIMLVEEIEKADENSLRWLLGVMDIRGNIRKLTYRSRTAMEAKMLCIATVNDFDLFKRMMSGALASRFSHQLYCPRPGRALLGKILAREISQLDGDEAWIEPTLDYLARHNITDPRKAMAICLTGRERLLNGEFQRQMDETMETSSPIETDNVRRIAR